MSARTLICPLLLTLALAHPAAAQNWDPFPTLPAGEHAAVHNNLDGPSWDNLRSCLKGLDSAVGAPYFAAVVNVTAANGSPSPQHSDAVPYVDALYQTWRAAGRLDAESHVLIALGISNRAVAVHPGRRWVERGFTDGTIRQTIESSSFGDYARGGDYSLALCDLALAIDRRLAALTVPSPPAEVQPSAPPSTRRAAPSDDGTDFTPIAVLGLLGGGGVAFVARRRRKKAKDRAEEELAAWRQRVETAAERLLAIETEHPLYFAITAERWHGESKALDQEAADAVNYVYLLYSKAYELVDQAQHTIETAGGWSVQPFEEAVALLRDTDVRIATGEVEDQRRIFLPLQREYTGKSSTLLEDLSAAYGDAHDSLRKVMEVADQAQAKAEAAGQAATAALQAANHRGELGLPVEPLKTVLDPLIEERQAADKLVPTDPIAATRRLAEATMALADLAAKAAAGNAAVEAVRGPIQELGRNLRQEVERLRGAGFRLAEPGFDPDLRLDNGVVEARRIEELLAAGDDEQAVHLRTELEAGLEELGEQMKASEAARDGVPTKLDELRAASRELAERAPAAERTLQGLESEHALEAFRDEADNLKELQTVLTRLDEWFAHIVEDHADERYLSALADIDSAESLLAEGGALLDAIAEVEKQLGEARENARDLAFRSKQSLTQLDERVNQSTAGIGAELRRAIGDLVARTSDSLEEAAGPKPQWLEVEESLTEVEEELRLTLEQVDSELTAYGESEQLARRLEGRVADLERRVSAETRDRAHVEHAVDAAARQLGAWKTRLREPEFSGSELLRQGHETETALVQANAAFESEMTLVRHAESRYRSADALVRQVEGRHYGYGVVADARAAHGALRQADEAMRRRDWENAVSMAQEAEERAEAERRRCRDQANMLELEQRRRLAARQEAERRRRQRAQRRMVRTIAPAMTGSLASSRSSRSSHSSFGRRSISAGTSFGRSNSGGSSW